MNFQFIVVLLFIGALIAGSNSLKIRPPSALEEGPLCGNVFDGNLRGRDVDVQYSLNSIKAQWDGFENGAERNRVLRYEWAVISQDQYDEAMNEQCRSNPGFRGYPDILGWQNAELKKSVESEVKLDLGMTYYVVLRWTTSFGLQYYSNSNGVKISENEEMPNLKLRSIESAVEEPVKRAHVLVDQAESPLTSNGVVFSFDITCPIDAENRCRQSQTSVGDYLFEIYGPPEFQNGVRNYDENEAFRTIPQGLDLADDDDDDDYGSGGGGGTAGFGYGAAIGIAIAIVALCFALFCIAVLVMNMIGGLLGGEDGKLSRNVGSKSGNLDEM